MKFLITFVLFSLLAPSEMVTSMMNSLYQPENVIVAEGADGENSPVLLEFDKSKGILKKTEKGEKSELKTKEMPLFLRLFFFSGAKNEPESWAAAAKSMTEALRSAGINTDLSTVSVSDFDGSAVLAIGKSKRFTDSNVLELSKESFRPATLKIGDETYVFSDYHRSSLPLVFPGNIKFYKNGRLSGEWSFLRSEYRNSER